MDSAVKPLESGEGEAKLIVRHLPVVIDKDVRREAERGLVPHLDGIGISLEGSVG